MESHLIPKSKMASEEKPSSDEDDGVLAYGTSIDKETFTQILDMDDPGSHEFSQGIILDFFSQARETFRDIDDALKNSDLPKLSSLGHFLKGSSATLGFIKVQDNCEKIQRYGKRENLDGTPGMDPDTCLKNIEKALQEVKKELGALEGMLEDYYIQVDGS